MSSLPDAFAFPTSPINNNQQEQQQSIIMEQEDQVDGASTPTPTTATAPEGAFSRDHRASSLFSDDKVAITWQSLSTLIAHAVHNLKESIRQNHSAYFKEDTITIVQRVRLLLYVSHCLDKETSVHLKLNKQLRTQHRSLLASLAKLVLSTKVASSAWPTPESLVKLQADSDDVLIAVRNFMMSAQDASVEIKELKPELTSDNSILRTSPFTIKNSNSVSLLGKTDVASATMVLADNVRGAMSSFMESVRDAFSNFVQQDDLKGTLTKLKANAPLLVAQFRNLSNTTSHFLNAIEEVCQAQQNNKSLVLLKSKQPIYTSMGALFVVSQMITSQDLDAEQVEAAYTRLEQCVNTIESSIQDVTEATQQHMEEMIHGGRVNGVEDGLVRNTPTPTQRQFNGSLDRMYNNYHTATAGSPTTPTSSHHTMTTDVFDEDGSEELLAASRRIDIGLNALMANPMLDATSIFSGDDRSDTSSLHSDIIATNGARPPKDTKIAKFFGEDTIAAARRRDTITATTPNNPAATMAAATSNVMNNAAALASTGTSAISSSTAGVTTAEAVPWFLQSDIDPNEMIFNMEGNVKGGSLHCLVQHLTQHDQLGE